MEIIRKGKLSGEFYQHRLIDIEGNVIARLYGDWVEKYVGRNLVIALDEDSDGVPWFEVMAEVLNPKEEG